ncbi:MAG TPA: DUF3575 domain-containing protein [Kofleriaceae bacterium]|jgi:hypothetical protein
MLRSLIALVLVSTASAAWGQAPGETASVVTAPTLSTPDDRPTRITIEPLYLVIGMVDLTLERQVFPHVTVGATAGYGKMLFGQATIWDLGVQSNVYLRANATGWHAGAQLRYLGVALADWLKTDEDKMMGDGRERLAGAYVGYTWVSDRGFTLMTQLGVGQMKLVNTTEGTKSQIAPIANFTLGWAL